MVLERRAERALDELAALTAPWARVWRDRRWRAVPAASVVVGDVVGVQEGDIVPDDDFHRLTIYECVRGNRRDQTHSPDPPH